jgi:hypothetical protein
MLMLLLRCIGSVVGLWRSFIDGTVDY